MTLRLSELTELVGGTAWFPEPNARSDGHPSVDRDPVITGSATIRSVQSGQITFATSEQAWKKCLASPAAAAIVSGFQPTGNLPCILVDHAETAFAKVTGLFRPAVQRHAMGISPRAQVSPLAKIGDNVTIYPNAFIGDHVQIGDNAIIMPGVCVMEHCRIGSDVTIYPNAVLYENTVVGDRSIIHAGVVLGAFGFGYRTVDGQHHLSSQLGNVEIGTDVEIGANSTIDRGTFDSTRVGSGTKIDNQVMIGHNCLIGEHNLLCSQVGIAGSCTTGSHVVMAGQVGIGDHIEIGDNVILGAKAGVMHSIDPNQHYLGIPATPIREQMLIMASIQKLPEIRKQVGRLAKQVATSIAPTSSAAREPGGETAVNESNHQIDGRRDAA